MKDIDLQIKEAFTKQNNNIEIPVEYKQMINNTLENLPSKTNRKHSKIFNFIIGLIATIFSITGVCFATSAISEHIKQNINQGKISNNELNYEQTRKLLNNNLEWENQNDFYFKSLTNSEDYAKYKEIIEELPEINKIDFNNNSVIVIYTLAYRKSADENNLIIDEITSNEETTYINLKPSNDAPSYNNIIYAIIEKNLLKPNIEIQLNKSNVDVVLPNLKPLSELDSSYDMDTAIKDGAVVVYYDYDHGILKSNNLDKLDKLVNVNYSELKIFKTPTKDDYIRIYEATPEGYARIYDIIGLNGIYYMNWTGISYNSSEELVDNTIFYECFEGILKQERIHYDEGKNYKYGTSYVSYIPFSERAGGYIPIISIDYQN